MAVRFFKMVLTTFLQQMFGLVIAGRLKSARTEKHRARTMISGNIRQSEIKTEVDTIM